MVEEFDADTLIAAARQHDEAAAREIVRRLYPLVLKLVRSHRPRRTAEEDLCQMIFIKVFQKLDQFSGKVPLKHWVSRIAINTCINQIQAEKVRPELRQADLSEEEAAMMENLATTAAELAPDQGLAARDLMERLLTSLPPAERLLIDMLYLQQQSVADVQALTGWGASRIKVRAFRARQKMRRHFEKLSAEGDR